MRSSPLVVIIATLAAAGALALGMAGTASGDVPKVAVGGQVSLKFDPPKRFFGRVSSRKPVCERNRRVALKYWMMPDSPVEVLDFDRTDAEGDWEIEIEPFATEGDYQAKVRRKVVHRPNKTIVCKRLLSIKHHF